MPPHTNPKNLELAAPQSVTGTRLDQLVYSQNCYIQIFQTQLFTRSEYRTPNCSKLKFNALPIAIYKAEILPCFTRRTISKLRTSKLLFLKSYLHKLDAKSHPSPLFYLRNTHIHDTHYLFNCTHIRTTLAPLDYWTDPAGVTELDGEARWWTTSGKTGLPYPLTREWVDNNNNWTQ